MTGLGPNNEIIDYRNDLNRVGSNPADPIGHKMSVSVGGRMEFDKGKRRWKFNGRWWKPWTWFRWRRYYEVTNFQMVEVSLVKQPSDPVCGIRYDEADCTPEELEELMQKCRDSRLGEEHHSEFLGVSPVNRCSARGMQEFYSEQLAEPYTQDDDA